MRHASLSLIFACSLHGGSIAAEPQWIWSSSERHGKGKATFAAEFQVENLDAGSAMMRVLADFCAAEVLLNGGVAARLEPFDDVLAVDVKHHLRPGQNRIQIRARAIDGPSALAFDLSLGGEQVCASGDSWDGAITVSPIGALDLEGSRLDEISALDEYNQWKEAKGGDASEDRAVFSELPPGFELERLYSATPEEGSWVSMVFDDRGLVIAREKKGLLRLRKLASGGFGAPQPIEDSLLECRGLLFDRGVLFANANNSKALYALRDRDGDGTYEDKQLLMETAGSVGHGRNDLATGPDGQIYSIHGDAVQLPAELSKRTPGFLGAGSPQGYLVSLDRSGGNRQLWCIGLRNPYGIAFNPDGEAFSFDADNEGDVGLPLYRPTRVNHLVSGANYGWRQAGADSWPVYAPESLPTTLDVGRGSPTAIAFGTGSSFPPEYRDALFILDWAYGRIIRVHLIPRGASYAGRADLFLRGRPLNVTDLVFAPDGAMYFLTGGRGTRSALYRIRYTRPAEENSANRCAQDVARAQHAKAARALRKKLEAFHTASAEAPLDVIFSHLRSPDPWVRNAARVALEHQQPQRWRGRALDEAEPQALLALLRVDAEAPIDRIVESSQRRPFAELDRKDKLAVLRVHQFALDREPRSPTRATRSQKYLASHFPTKDAAVNRELANLLVRLGDPQVVSEAIAILSRTGSQFERLHYLHALSRASSGWTAEGRKRFFAALAHPDYFRGDRNMPAYLKAIRNRAVSTLSEEERTALGALLEPAKPNPLPDPLPTVRAWTFVDLSAPAPPGFVADPEEGARQFERALCSRCHQLGALGQAVGPNLTQIANRMSRDDMLRAILEPSRAVAEIFQGAVITKTDGTVVSGRLVRDDFRESTVSIASNPFQPGDLLKVRKADIASHARSPASPMPAGLLDPLTREEILHLLAFLESGGRAPGDG